MQNVHLLIISIIVVLLAVLVWAINRIVKRRS
jgi:hypothetical protein